MGEQLGGHSHPAKTVAGTDKFSECVDADDSALRVEGEVAGWKVGQSWHVVGIGGGVVGGLGEGEVIVCVIFYDEEVVLGC